MAKKARATLLKIAKAAKVSTTTVSNVVNGRLNLMSEETRRRVEKIIQQENYRPNEEARNLRLSQRRTIGLIVVTDSPTFLADPMITNIVAGMSNYLGVNGYSLLISGIAHAAIEGAQMLRRDQTDAICVFPSGPASERRRLFSLLRPLGQPIAVFQDQVPDKMPDVVSIRQDDHAAGRLIAERLCERGARRLAFVSPVQSWSAMAEREAGVREVVEARGLSLGRVVSASEAVDDTKLAMSRYCEQSGLPDAVLGGNDQMAIAVINWALDRTLRVPEDLRVVGFNGFDFSRLARPELTTVVSPAYEIGRRGAAIVVDRLREGHFAEKDVVFNVALRAGYSD